jgi:hypothetical protein
MTRPKSRRGSFESPNLNNNDSRGGKFSRPTKGKFSLPLDTMPDAIPPWEFRRGGR